MNKPETIGTETWGRDHYSLLAYLETCAVDKKGVVDTSRLRINSVKRGFGNSLSALDNWKESYATHLKGNLVPDPQHDDLDVLAELEEVGWVENLGTNLFPLVKMTELGQQVAAALRAFRSVGGMYRDF